MLSKSKELCLQTGPPPGRPRSCVQHKPLGTSLPVPQRVPGVHTCRLFRWPRGPFTAASKHRVSQTPGLGSQTQSWHTLWACHPGPQFHCLPNGRLGVRPSRLPGLLPLISSKTRQSASLGVQPPDSRELKQGPLPAGRGLLFTPLPTCLLPQPSSPLRTGSMLGPPAFPAPRVQSGLNKGLLHEQVPLSAQPFRCEVRREPSVPGARVPPPDWEGGWRGA